MGLRPSAGPMICSSLTGYPIEQKSLLLLFFLHLLEYAGTGDVLRLHLAGGEIEALLPDLLIAEEIWIIRDEDLATSGLLYRQ